MKKTSWLLRLVITCLFIISGSIPCIHAQNFEGIIHYQFPDNESKQMADMQYMVKNARLRWQFGEENQKGAMLYLPKESKMVFLIEQMHSYIKMDTDKMNDNQNYNKKWADSKLVKTHQTKTIAGYECTVWKVTNNNEDMLTMCMAKGLGTFMTPGNPMSQKHAPGWAKKIIADGYMPLEVVETEAGSKTTKMKAVKIEKKSLDDSLFKIPDGYKDMSAMMKQMQKMRNQKP